MVTDKGQFALRGGIVDIFPVSSAEPFRIDFFSDTIDEIRTFDPVGQRSIKKIDQLFFTPACEYDLLLKETNLQTLFDYLGKETILIYDNLVQLEDVWVAMSAMPGAKSRFLQPFETILKNDYTHLFFPKENIELLGEIQGGVKEKNFQKITFSFAHHTFPSVRYFHPFVPLQLFLDHPLAPKTKKVLLANDETLKEKVPDAEFLKGYLDEGFIVSDIPMALITESDILNKKRIRRQKWRGTFHSNSHEFHALTPGDLVVHFHSGIGKFLGMENQNNHLGQPSEFMVIEYAENSKLFVPLSQAHLVSRYVGSNDTSPTLSDLGSKKWLHTRAKVQKEILGYAAELLSLYATREVEKGLILTQDSKEVEAFAKEFPYEATPDQLVSLSDIYKDLATGKPMDRLICGDVGYGKTEVAMRAAFKVVVDGGKQVAVLVPTTVLASQHFDTFAERMQRYGIIIEALFRFKTEKELRSTAKRVKEGSVDIVIGTHRLLSKDISFYDLGLIIIDEEQRFGVKAKEHLKKLKQNVHCLTLSATPIPRTLYMSLVKAKDMSVIHTPPQDRLPIKSILAENDDELIQNAIIRELTRQGQVFFIHNRVESIYNKASHIEKLVPSARIAVVHGQMDSDAALHIFHAFKQGDFDILLSTTIVENGIDVPNANTILIDRADTFGLADLYQLRGRVGRWNRTAYAYFLTPKNKLLPEVVRKRLSALLESGGYGGGMKIAMRDLEIRGAGNILGVEQSGQVSTIGFHLYCRLLKRAIHALKKQGPVTFIETRIEFPYDARLPENYINDSGLRMEIYHRLGESANFEEIDQILEELKDRFGDPPLPTLWLYRLSRLRVFAAAHQFLLIKFEKTQLITIRHPDKKESFPLPKDLSNPEKFEKEIFALLTK